MSESLSPVPVQRLWWLSAVRGGALVLLGFLMLVQPLTTLRALVWVLGIFVVVDGLVALTQGLTGRGRPGAGWWVAQGIAGLAFGLLVMAWPDATTLVLYYLMALWILVVGVLGIIGAVVGYRMRDLGWTWSLAFGLVGFLFGLLLVMKPQETLEVLVVVFGLFAFVDGVVLLVSTFATRSLVRQLDLRSR